MRLINPQRETSFYESFSDLVFNTLILLLVLVVAMAVRLKSSQERLDRAQAQLVDPSRAADLTLYPNRFSGAADATYIYAALVPVDGVTSVVFIPAEVEARWGFVRFDGGPDPVLDLCRLALAPDGLPILSAADFIALAPGLTPAVADSLAWNWRSALAVARLIELRRLAPEAWAAFDPRQLRDAIGGPNLDDPERDSPDPRLASSRDAWVSWSLAGAESLYARQSETLDPLRARLADSDPAQPPVLRFQLTDDGLIRVGESTLSPAAFRGLLRALKPGKGFYLEFLSADGSEQPPPPWIMTEILEPTGFASRLPRPQPLRSAPPASPGP